MAGSRHGGQAESVPLYFPGPLPALIDPQAVRPSLELVDLPFAFSQTPLLDESQFIREAARRGVGLDRGELEALHRRGALVPLFRVLSRPAESPRPPAPEVPTTSGQWHIHRLREQGVLADPVTRRFTPWPAKRRGPVVYFSVYQLLSLRSLPHLQSRMEATRTQEGIAWHLPPLGKHEVAAYARSRALAIVLEVLSPRYRPHVVSLLRSPSDDLQALVVDRDPVRESNFLQLRPDLLLRQAEVLLANARHFDPLGKWQRVTRIANPRRWDDLQHDALIAQEQRVAAEMILAYLEDEARSGRAEPIP